MKKLIVFALIGWMSVLAVMNANAQIVAFHGGYSFDINQGAHPGRTDFAVDYMQNHGAFGIGTKFPSAHNKSFEVNLHAGMAWYWDNFMISPQFEVAYNTVSSSISSESENVYKPTSGVSIGGGLIANYKIVGPLGAFLKVRYLSPVGFDPLKVGPGGTTTFSLGLTMFWFK